MGSFISTHRSRDRRRHSGYTLVELSIVIIIIGLLTAGGLAAGAAMVERAAYVDTRKLIDQIHQSIKDFYIVNGHLPCAARMTLTPGDANFGAEVNCSAAVAGTWRSGGVRIGAVPTRALGLTDTAASDRFGSRLVYAVTEGLTNVGSFGSSDGAITVRDMNNNNILTNAAFFISSPGRDRKGAYNHLTGTQVNACTPATNLDVLNCPTASPIFRDAPFNNGEVAARFFDDVTAWAPKFHFLSYDTQTYALWSSQSGSPNIFSIGTDGNPSTTNVGIGTSAPTARLHVTGGDFRVGTNTLFARASDNNVGIGTSNPLARLHSAGNIRTDAREILFGANQSMTTNGSSYFYLNSATTTQNRLYFRDSNNVNLANIFTTNTTAGLQAGTSTRLSFSIDGSTSSYIYQGPTNNQRFVFIGANTFTQGAFMYLHGRAHGESPGQIALVAATNGTTGTVQTHTFGRYPSTGGSEYHAMGRMYANGNLWLEGAITGPSDQRLKTDIAPIASPLEKLATLNGVTFRWNGKGRMSDTETRHLGLIAQEVQSVFPEAVTHDKGGYLALDKSALIAPLVEAVKQLKAENETLRQEMAALKPASNTAPQNIRMLDWVLLTGLSATLLLLAAIWRRGRKTL